MGELRYYIGAREVTKEELLKYMLKLVGLDDAVLLLPQDRYFALEYGEPLAKGDETYRLIRASLAKECNFTGAELDKQTKRQYALFTNKHAPYPFIESLQEAVSEITSDDVYKRQTYKILETAVKERLKEYNDQGVCTLGLANYVKLHKVGDHDDGKDEHEAV